MRSYGVTRKDELIVSGQYSFGEGQGDLWELVGVLDRLLQEEEVGRLSAETRQPWEADVTADLRERVIAGLRAKWRRDFPQEIPHLPVGAAVRFAELDPTGPLWVTLSTLAREVLLRSHQRRRTGEPFSHVTVTMVLLLTCAYAGLRFILPQGVDFRALYFEPVFEAGMLAKKPVWLDRRLSPCKPFNNLAAQYPHVVARISYPLETSDDAHGFGLTGEGQGFTVDRLWRCGIADVDLVDVLALRDAPLVPSRYPARLLIDPDTVLSALG